jgi:hypothetical protein
LQDGRGIKRAAPRFAEFLFCLAACVRALCAFIDNEWLRHCRRVSR